MGKIYSFLRYGLIVIFFASFSCLLKAQKVIDPSKANPNYDIKKSQAFKKSQSQVTSKIKAKQVNPYQGRPQGDNSCFIPRDSTYIPVPRNDDGSLPLALPFSFNLYGTTYSNIYINTNGNISFTSAVSAYAPSGFPISTPMVAAFWADIDTRNTAGGQIYYKLTPTHLIVTWDSVGHYNQSADLLNTFQIIIGIQGDSLLGPGNNVKFNYKNLQWASSGGFGATTAATVGVNSGSNNNYIQVGRFNQDNSDYDGPGGLADGIHYLENICFPFNVTSSQNIPPSVSNLPNTSSVTINIGDTIKLNPNFIGPEVGQTVTTVVDTRNECRVTHIDSNGLVSKVDLTFIADTCNVGTNVITFTATDNGTPVQSTIINYTIIVNKLNQTITFPAIANVHFGRPLTLRATASSKLPITYTVTGPATVSGSTLTITGVGTVTVTATQPGNNVFNAATSVVRSFCVLPSKPGLISGDSIVCANTQEVYNVSNVAGATFSWTLSGGGTITYTGVNATVQWTTPGTYTLSVKYNGNCGTSDSTRTLTVHVDNKLTGTFSNLLPANGNTSLLLPLTFSWSRIDSALFYDLYIWPSGSVKPATPTVIGITALKYVENDSALLHYETLYNWQIVARRSCYTISSTTQTFTLRYSPDLVPDSISVPVVGFSGKTIKVSWRVKNIGKRVTTTSSWTDRVYVSANPVFSAGSALVQYDYIHTGNLSPDSAYIQSQDILLPQKIQGKYYIHVFTDANKQLTEYNPGGEGNNIRISDPVAVNLKMPADLFVTQLTAPLKASAGQKTNIKWTVKNQGDTAINTTSWNDKIYISSLPVFNIAGSVLMANYSHSGGLDANTEYSNSVLVNVPVLKGGNYYIYVVTDADNSAAEYDESNNIRRSDALVQIGIPDLVVSNVAITGTVNTGQTLNVKWNIRNGGTGATETASWTDRIFLSPNATYTPNNAIWFDVKFAAQTLSAGAVVSREINLKLPDIVSGKYYAYVYTDFTNTVYEDTSEFNNISRSVGFSNITTGLPVNDIGISEIITPQSDCGLTSSETVMVKISNYGNLPHTNFAVSYRLNNGALITENVGSGSLAAGSTLLYTFTAKANLLALGNYSIKAYTSLANDTLHSNDTLTRVITHFPTLTIPSNLFPANGSVNLDRAVNFSWAGVPNATKYDLYVWKSTDSMPSVPTTSNLSQINYSYYNGLIYGTSYKWKVVAKSNNCQTSGPIQTFSIRNLPDLVVDSIIVPTNGGTSETPFSVSWRILNKGLGATNSNWYESVFISESATDRSRDILINNYGNVSALGAGLRYMHPLITFNIPQGYQGTYYIVIRTNSYIGGLEEVTDTNNVRLIPINITLLPPPDLQVDTLVVSPTTLFSDDTINVKWTIKNHGTGPTTGSSSWADYVYLSKNHILDKTAATLLGVFGRTGALAVNGTYTKTTKLKLPAYIGGSYFIHVVTDATNQVFEYTRENNNIATWDSINVVMRPTPNLTISSVTAPTDTISNNQSVSFQWITKNEGAATANPLWTDNMRFTSDTANGYSRYTDLGYYNQNNILQSLSAAGAQQTIQVPYNLSEGKYFFYVVSDIFNRVFEGGDEADNVSPYSPPVYVANPDLKPLSLTAPAAAKSEESVTLAWSVSNAGKGNIYNSGWADAIYLSTDTIFGTGDQLLTSVENSLLLLSGDQYKKQQTVVLPRGIKGTYYLILVTDSRNAVFEKNENNNQFNAKVIISAAPWPDLQITGIKLPAKDTAGTSITFSYTGKNSGTAKIDNKSWIDEFYLSATKTLTDPNKIPLAYYYNQRSLDTVSSYTNTVTATLPSNISGKYYLLGTADFNDNIYEYTSENNNNRISDTTVLISQLPNVDLAAVSGKVTADSLTPGQTVTVEWNAKNAGTTPTIITEWEDAVYLSNNTTLDAADQLLGTVKVNKLLSPGDPYYQKTKVSIPNDASGTLYFLLNVDKNGAQNDANRANNTKVLDIIVKDSGQVIGTGGGVVIVQPKPSDLVPVSFKVPANAASGQPFTISYTVKNNGTGATNADGWTDKVYLSTDNNLDFSDIQIGSFPHSVKLAAGLQYTDTQRVFIPSSISGNYIVIIKTDAYDNVFELNAENNNTASGNILIQPQQPCDLLVTNVTPPAGTQIAGRTITVNYTIKNASINPAYGYCKDAVYLSTDTVWDINDLLLGTSDYGNTVLLPQASVNRQLTKKLVNVATGKYFIIVRTDVLNNLVEVDENNNTLSSVSPMPVDVKLLTMNVAAADTLVNDELLYYRIIIPAAQKGETMLLTLRGDSARSAVNKLYIRFNEAPAANAYDVASEIPFSANQDVIVPELQAGTYYIMASGSDTATNNQKVTLLARIIPFEITKVDANKGGNTGAVTVKINGAKFDSTTAFRLQSKTNGIITASKIYYTNSTQVFATFNLLHAGLGIYDVVAVKANNDSAKLINGFEVVKGTGSVVGDNGTGPGSGTGFVCQIVNIGFDDKLQTDLALPASTRPDRVVEITVQYVNNSTVDIPTPTRILVSLTDGVPVSLSVDTVKAVYRDISLANMHRDVLLDFNESGGPPGILRPGASGFIKAYSICLTHSHALKELEYGIVE